MSGVAMSTPCSIQGNAPVPWCWFTAHTSRKVARLYGGPSFPVNIEHLFVLAMLSQNTATVNREKYGIFSKGDKTDYCVKKEQAAVALLSV